MANQKSLKGCEEKVFINDDISLLKARLAKASGLRADVKSVAMLNEEVVFQISWLQDDFTF